MHENTRAFLTVGKAILVLIFLPIVAIWFVWKKTNWKTGYKFAVTVAIAVVFLIVLGARHEEPVKPQNDSAAKIAELQRQLAAEKKKNAGLEKEAEGTVESPKEETNKISHVVDGDTLKLASGEVVRLIGIDAPETVDPEKPVQCFGPEASAEMKKLAAGKSVKLEKDVSEKDQYGRLLRYVWVGDTFLNDFLVRQGFAKADNFPPDEKYESQLKAAQQEAKDNKRGMWAPGACDAKVDVSSNVSTQERIAVPTSVPTPVPTTTPAATSSSYTCNCKKTCPQMSSCAEAQYQLNTCGCSARDADHDGVACDSDCQ